MLVKNSPSSKTLLLKSWAAARNNPCIWHRSSRLTWSWKCGFLWPEGTDRGRCNAVEGCCVCAWAHTTGVLCLLGQIDSVIVWPTTPQCSEKENGNEEYWLWLPLSQETLQTVSYIFCSCSLVITLLASVRVCQFASAEVWPSTCLKFIGTIHRSVSRRLRVLWGSHHLSCRHIYPLSRHAPFVFKEAQVCFYE